MIRGIFLTVLASYLIVLSLMCRRRWNGRAPADVPARYTGRVVTVGLGTELVTKRTGRLTVNPADWSLSLHTDETTWPIWIGDARWFVDPDTPE